MPTSHHRSPLAASLLVILCITSFVRADDLQPPLRDWGEETLAMIQRDFQTTPDLWAAGVQLSSLTAAAKVDRKYLPDAEHYSSWMIAYFGKPNDLAKGLSAKLHGGHFYDDNEWVVLDLLELHQLTNDASYLKQAGDIFQFIRGGEDATFGGGIWWQHKHETKNTCSNAPAIVAALELYEATHDQEDLTMARRLYEWTNAHFLDADGLYFDHISVDGTMDRTKWSYNTALMIRANLLLAEILHEPKYLAEAQRLGKAAIGHWVRGDGVIADDAPFAHLLCGALLKLSAADHDATWREAVRRALDTLHQKGRDPRGHYADRWDQFPTEPIAGASLIAQASAARTYWESCGAFMSPSIAP